MSIKRAMIQLGLAGLSLGGLAQAAERDYIGWPYDMGAFPLCQRYGCKETGRQQLERQSGSFVHLQLLDFDARVTLVLDPDQTTMGIYVLVPGKTLSHANQNFLEHVMAKSVNEALAPAMLPKCFRTLHVPAQDYDLRAVIRTQGHYGVQCLRKREQDRDYWGIWIFFDN